MRFGLALLSPIMGPFWSEYLVMRALRQKGWAVLRNVNVYCGRTGAYVELDVLAVSGDAMVLAEVKSWRGGWESRDDWFRPRWIKHPALLHVRSPVAQLAHARQVWFEVLRENLPKLPGGKPIWPHRQSFVFVDRGWLVNAAEPEVQAAWRRRSVVVAPISQRFALPTATRPADPELLAWLHAYHAHFRWRP